MFFVKGSELGGFVGHTVKPERAQRSGHLGGVDGLAGQGAKDPLLVG